MALGETTWETPWWNPSGPPTKFIDGVDVEKARGLLALAGYNTAGWSDEQVVAFAIANKQALQNFVAGMAVNQNPFPALLKGLAALLGVTPELLLIGGGVLLVLLLRR